jgi:hypothetical protein
LIAPSVLSCAAVGVGGPGNSKGKGLGFRV